MALSQRPVPPVPDYARASTEALRQWLKPLVWHTWKSDYWPQTYAFIAWKGLIFIIASALLLVIIKRGEFWLVRKVTGPRGPMLVVKATDAPLMAAAVFVGVDAVYRGLTIHWWLGPNFNYHKNELVWEAMRLFPAWMTAHIHLCSSCLVWPLPAHRVHPWLWHAFLLGVPAAFFTAFLPPVVLSSNHCARTYHLWERIDPSLAARPGQVPTPDDISLAQAVHAEAAVTAHYLALWALVGAIFVAITLCGSAIVGWTLSRRVAKARRKLEAEPTMATLSGDTFVGAATGSPITATPTTNAFGMDRRSNLSSDHEAAVIALGGGDESASWGAASSDSHDGGKPSGRPRVSHSPIRMIKYLIGVSPFRGTEPEVLRKPVTPASARRVLRNFHFHCSLESVALVSLLCLIFGIVIYLLTSAYETVYANAPDPVYGNGFMRVAYLYHVVEMWGVVLFGSTFAISVLYRSAFPTKVDTVTVTVATKQIHASRHRRESSAHKSANAALSHTLELSSNSAPSDKDEASASSPTRISAVLDSAKAAVRKWPSVRRPTSSRRGDAVVAANQATDASSVHTSETHSNAPLAGSAFAPSGSFGRLGGPALLEGHRSNLADAGSFAGMGVGRSIVLEALSAGTVTSMTQRRKAAWRTQPFTFEAAEAVGDGGVGLGVVGVDRGAAHHGDIERSASTLRRPASRGMFATPHGLVEGIATTPSTMAPTTPQTLHMNEFTSPSIYATPSPRTADGLWSPTQRY